MRNTKFPLPKKSRIYVIFCVVFGILVFGNIFVAGGITGGKELRDFTQQDWYFFALFLLTEVVLFLLSAFFAKKAGKQREKQVKQYYDQFKFAGIELGDYDHVWFDFSGDERAKIIIHGDAYYLFVDCFDEKTELWSPLGTVSVFSSLAEIKKALFYECDFYCEENAVLDEHGDEIFRDEQDDRRS